MTKVGKVIRENLIGHLRDGLEKNSNAFVVTYTKVSGQQMNTLRLNMRKVGAKIFVSKNKLAQLALKELKQDKLAERLKGQTAFVVSNMDTVEVSKALMKFVKDAKGGVVVQGGVLNGAILEKRDVERLADLPSKQALQAQLLSILVSPVTQFLYVLNGKTQDLLSIMKQLSEKKGGK